jgi:peptide/nickel transport system substrate-binding protein
MIPPIKGIKKRRSLFSKKIAAFFLFMVFFPPLADCEKAEFTESSDAYVSASIGDARVLIPFLADDTASASICQLVYNGLTKLDKDLNVIGDLAERWEIKNNGLTIVFHLRKNVKWHDGAPFTAEDVKYSFDKVLDPRTGSPYISGFIDIKAIKVIDPYAIVFEYERPYAAALIKLGMGIVPKHLFEKADDARRSVYARYPVGTGPYKFGKWETGQHIILEANKDHFEHVPGVKRYVYRVIPDQSVEFLELLAGGIDSMQLNPYQYRYRTEEPRFKDHINKYEYLAPAFTYIGYNLKDPLFLDKRVRQALSYGINTKEIIDSALLGLGEPCSGPLRKDTAYYDKSVEPYPFDPGKARALLAEAGWADTDGDGVLEKDGKEFRFKIVTNQGNQTREDVATIVQRQWSEIGVKAEVLVLSWGALLDEFIDKGNFQATIMAWELPADPDMYPIWHSKSIGKGGLNFVSYSEPVIDSLIEAGRCEMDEHKRIEIYKKIHRKIADDAPYTFLFFGYRTPAINKRFNGVIAAPAGIGYNFIDWYVEPSKVKYDF